MLGHIELAARRAADLTAQMLAYAGGRKASHVPVDLSAAVRDSVTLLSVTVPEGTLFELDLDDNLPAVMGDPGQMHQVAMNLLTNAAESLGGNPGRVAATTKVQYLESIELRSPFLPGDLPPGNYCCLEVTDAGSGMSEATVKQIFDPFFTTKDRKSVV